MSERDWQRLPYTRQDLTQAKALVDRFRGNWVELERWIAHGLYLNRETQQGEIALWLQLRGHETLAEQLRRDEHLAFVHDHQRREAEKAENHEPVASP